MHCDNFVVDHCEYEIFDIIIIFYYDWTMGRAQIHKMCAAYDG